MIRFAMIPLPSFAVLGACGDAQRPAANDGGGSAGSGDAGEAAEGGGDDGATAGEGEGEAGEGEGEGEAGGEGDAGGEGEAGGEGDAGGEGEAGGEGDAGGEGGGEAGGDGEACWQAASFMELDDVEGPGPQYPAPELSADCEGDELVVRSNGIIHYEFQQMTPNALSALDYTWVIPLTPEPLDEPADIPLLGTAGIGVNGLPFYGPNEGAMPDPYGDPIYNGLMDFCGGHTAQRGDYHDHQLLVECLTDSGQAPADGQPSPIVGWSLDGYPIYGPWGCMDADCDTAVKFKSGWARTGDPETYAWDNHAYQPDDDHRTLDRCNGRVGPDGTYRYHATDSFPYILGCYHGRAEGAGAGGPDGGGGPPDGGGGPPDGGPPDEAFDACEGKADGDDCEFEGQRGVVEGVCFTPPGGQDLVCRPEGPPGPPGGG